MRRAGVTPNIMSLGVLAFGVGMLVDNSIVVLEASDRHRRAGADRPADQPFKPGFRLCPSRKWSAWRPRIPGGFDRRRPGGKPIAPRIGSIVSGSVMNEMRLSRPPPHAGQARASLPNTRFNNCA